MEIDADIPKARDRRRSLMVELRNSNFQRSIRNLARVSPEVQNSLLEQLNPDEKEEEIEIALHGERSWQVRALTFMHSPFVEWTLSLLLVADLLINFFDLYYMEPSHPDCYIVWSRTRFVGTDRNLAVPKKKTPQLRAYWMLHQYS